MGADNQQERLDASWIAGFTDARMFSYIHKPNSKNEFEVAIAPELISRMNRKPKLKYLESSETER